VNFGAAPSRAAHRRLRRREQVDRVQAEAVCALNALAAATAGNPLRAAPGRSHQKGISRVQKDVLQNVRDCAVTYAKVISETPVKGALCELLKTSSVYDNDMFCNRVPLDISKIKVLRGETKPIPIASVIGPDARHFVTNPMKFIPRSAAEIDRHALYQAAPVPYSDPALRNPVYLKKLITKLHYVGLITFRLKVRSFLGFFAVGKKDGSQRLIGDAREPNWIHRRAPYSPLAAAGAIANVTWPADNGADPEGAGVDFQDGFYQFAFDAMACYFGIRLRVRAKDFGVTRVFDD